MDGFNPPGRKKFISDASTNGTGLPGSPPGLQPLTVNGLEGQRLSRNGSIYQSGIEVRHHQVAADRVGVDGPIEVASAVEVIGETQCVSIAEIALDAQVRLLRIRVDEVLRLRIAEGLESEAGRRWMYSDNSDSETATEGN